MLLCLQQVFEIEFPLFKIVHRKSHYFMEISSQKSEKKDVLETQKKCFVLVAFWLI